MPRNSSHFLAGRKGFPPNIPSLFSAKVTRGRQEGDGKPTSRQFTTRHDNFQQVNNTSQHFLTTFRHVTRIFWNFRSSEHFYFGLFFVFIGFLNFCSFEPFFLSKPSQNQGFNWIWSSFCILDPLERVLPGLLDFGLFFFSEFLQFLLFCFAEIFKVFFGISAASSFFDKIIVNNGFF